MQLKHLVVSTIVMAATACGFYAGNAGKPDGGTTQQIGGACRDGSQASLAEVHASDNHAILTFRVPPTIDPCSVTGYMVGQQSLFNVSHRADDSFFIDQLPEGKHDYIVVAKTMDASGLNLGTENVGARLGAIVSFTGKIHELGTLEFLPLGGVSGKVTLNGAAQHGGIDVYIPGTSYAAKTDDSGSYTIAGVPAGEHNVFFEKDGYHRGQIEAVVVPGGGSIRLSDIELMLSTGAEGFLVVANGAAIYTSQTVTVTVGASADAVLMKISESINFTGASWRPLKTTMTYSFDSDGAKTLYVKFANANGLESSPFSASITIDSTAPTLTITHDFAGYETPTITVVISPEDTTGPVKMKIGMGANFDSAPWEDYNSSKAVPFVIGKKLKVQLKDRADFISEIVSTEMSYTAALSQARSLASALTFGTKILFAAGYAGNVTSNIMDVFDSVSSTWSTVTLPRARGATTAAAVGTKALFAGGPISSVSSGVVDIYDVATNSWSAAWLSQARQGEVSATVGDKVLFAGGRITGSTRSDVVDIYDSATDSWSTATLSQSRENLSAAVAGGKVLFAGGSASGNAVSNVVDVYDSATNSWSTATLSQARAVGLSAAVVGGKVLFAGGYGLDYSNVVDIYDSGTNTWSTATLSQARSNVRAAAVGGKVLFAGGDIGSGVLSSVVDIYDSATNTWSTASLSEARRIFAVTTVGSKTIFAGGFMEGGTSNVIDIYDGATDTWSTASLSQARRYLTAATVGAKALFAGGDADTPSKVVDVYDSTTNTWGTRLSMPAGD